MQPSTVLGANITIEIFKATPLAETVPAGLPGVGVNLQTGQTGRDSPWGGFFKKNGRENPGDLLQKIAARVNAAKNQTG